ncbi:hypothetical protein ACH5RR_028858 [Cinchona calisaya]|uniref:Uncharacterized protein n=1 Tax=Cinchona calisaya TaxID=153742 RepID=A0ABD2YQ02_9GENT
MSRGWMGVKPEGSRAAIVIVCSFVYLRCENSYDSIFEGIAWPGKEGKGGWLKGRVWERRGWVVGESVEVGCNVEALDVRVGTSQERWSCWVWSERENV